MTRVLIDASSLSDDSAYRGIGTYVRSLLGALAIRPDLSVSALAPAGSNIPDGIASMPILRRAPGRLRPLERELRLPVDLRRAPHDVSHSPALDLPLSAPAPWVATLHDLIPLLFDDPALAAERRRFRCRAPRLRRAAGIVAISRHTADTGITHLGLDPARVEVIPHGVDPRFRPPGEPPTADRRPYVLSVGEYSRRKGYAEAFAAAGALAEHGHPHRLHVTGRIAPWVRPTVEALVAAAPRPERVVLRGFVADLVAEYGGASALVMTSRYEGFGLPILEAMACGVPVVAFANSAVSEVVADAGILVPDGDVPSLAAALHGVLSDPARHEELRARGLEHAARFTWERSAAAHAELYRTVAANTSR